MLTGELEAIRSQRLLFCYGSYEVFCAPSDEIPHLLLEIGRLRELTFRQVGEGTQKAIDTDHFDDYYHHLFIWNNETQTLVGAYRMGMGDQIMKRYGLNGFYTRTLFEMDTSFGDVMEQSIEMGRSFIAKDYQGKPIPLKLLWKGIFYVLLKNKQYRYLMGPVTISGEYTAASKLALSAYIRNNQMDPIHAQQIHPKVGMAVRCSIEESLIRGVVTLDLIHKLICDIEEGNGVPVLIKRYFQLNSKALGFNTDHEFSDALDVLILLDLHLVPEEMIRMLSKEMDLPVSSLT